MRYEIQTKTLCDGWINCWTGGEHTIPLTFTTKEAAEAEITEHLNDVKEAVERKDMDSEYSRDDYRIVESILDTIILDNDQPTLCPKCQQRTAWIDNDDETQTHRCLNEKCGHIFFGEFEDENQYTNYYVHCESVWSDNWSCMCNNDCPECGTGDIEPFMSIDNLDPKEKIMHVDNAFKPEQGWPEGVTNTKELVEFVEENI